jgi:hypothetical protein
MFAEDVVPERDGEVRGLRVLGSNECTHVLKRKKKKYNRGYLAYHSVSALGSSTGTFTGMSGIPSISAVETVLDAADLLYRYS